LDIERKTHLAIVSLDLGCARLDIIPLQTGIPLVPARNV
jgi:hypothetical protein